LQVFKHTMKVNKKIHFEVSERKILLRVFDSFFIIFFLYLSGNVFKINYFEISLYYYFVPILLIYINVFGSVFELYNLQASNEISITAKSVFLTTTTTVVLFLLTPYYTPSLPTNRLEILVFFGTVLISFAIWRLLYISFLVSDRFIKNVILICDKNQVKELVLGLENNDSHYKIIGFINTDSEQNGKKDKDFIENIAVDNLENFVIQNAVKEIVVASKKTDGITPNLYNHLIHLLESGFIIRDYTQVYETITHRIPIQYVAKDFYKYFPFSRSNNNQLYKFIVRVFDVSFATIGIFSGVIFVPIIIIANIFANKGKLFYTQERVGKNGVIFKIFKFRSMVKNAEKDGAVFATTNDLRVTRFGRFLRKSRIDEFPQFINILKGDMSVIGPRPERPVFVYEIASQMPFYQTRHVIKPGLTGWAQVCYPYGASIEDSLMKLEYDLYYIKHRSLLLDLNIFFKTVSTVLFYRGQ
jgi:exopolysaccharide biosynthesis polyprenyl glycosylphosphotransferase